VVVVVVLPQAAPAVVRRTITPTRSQNN